MKVEITISEIGKRIDVIISHLLPQFSRTKIQKLISLGRIKNDSGVILNASNKITAPCIIEIDNLDVDYEYEITPEEIDLDIVFEDEFIIVINKPEGMVCHPAPGHRTGTLVNAIVYHCKNRLSNIGGSIRPGIIHRLDKDTSGLMIIAKTNEAHMAFANLFANQKGNLIKRKYTCFVFGIPSPRCSKIETYITRHPRERQMFIAHDSIGKHSVTLYEVEKSVYFTSTKAISKVTCELLTGRTHQIRVHMKHIGCNIIGDKMYGKSKIEPVYPPDIRNFGRQALHSSELEFQHPFTRKWLHFISETPKDMLKLEKIF